MDQKNKRFFWLSFFFGLMGCQSKEELAFEQYKINGEEIYLQQCANCHQASGEGLKGVIPPLKDTDFLTPDRLDQVICLIKNGINEPLQVNGVTYTQAMPPHGSLQSLDIAAVSTYIYSKWGGMNRRITVMEVDSSLAHCRR